MADLITNLPEDNGAVSPRETEILSKFFGEQRAPLIKEACVSNKDLLFAGIVFAVLSLSWIGSLITKMTGLENEYVILAIKALLFIIILFFAKHYNQC